MTEQEIGGRISAARAYRGMTQADLTQRVQEYGLPWYQSTVSKVERGERPLRASELTVVAAVLGVQVGDILTSGRTISGGAEAVERLVAAAKVVNRATDKLQFDGSRTQLQETGRAWAELTLACRALDGGVR